ncbi:alpha/beta fold hydrolase [Microbacterium ulmi]|uniref:Alpha/beta hydrolase n=1 Tax=Microbacterium ulmi TaxID=179095 RepID=A0A7Y2LYP9_9MICO|nr:alpha/beta hydrolase [Microbacterium ulmi]NII68461.1 pimeloyl-ACP methyl ester carboxylesterase [Microbacterium ulmi]NNH03017.1 alpha/beta hydrolase [Microbacterium ulmi]
METQLSAPPAMPTVEGVEHRWIALSDGRMHVALAGAGDPVLLLSGFGQTWWEWRDIIPALAPRYRLIAPDLRGEGWSELPVDAISRTRRCADVLELLSALELDRVRIVSHDMGAITAMQLALQHPDRVVAQVMLGVPPVQMRFSPALLPGMRHLWFEEALAIPGLGARLLRGGRLPRWLYSHFSARPLADDVVDRYVSLLRDPGLARAGSMLNRRMVLPELGRIVRGTYRGTRYAMPSLFAFGAEDVAFPPAVARAVLADTAEFGDDVELAFVEGAAHFVADEAPAATARLVAEFFEAHPGRASA